MNKNITRAQLANRCGIKMALSFASTILIPVSFPASIGLGAAAIIYNQVAVKPHLRTALQTRVDKR